MAKSMARIENGIVVNIEWCPDNLDQTDTFVDIGDKIVFAGNTYINGKFYDNDGNEILTDLECARKQLVEYEHDLAELDAALLEAQYQNLIGGL